jgi:hypothetical protein
LLDKKQMPVSPPTTCLFNELPEEVVARLIGFLVQKIRSREEGNLGFTADDCPVPLPLQTAFLPLQESMTDGMAVVQAVKDTLEKDFQYSVDPFFRSVLVNTILFSREKVLLVVYSRRSLEMEPYDKIRQRLKRLVQYVNQPGSKPSQVYIASDDSHKRMLCDHLGLK